MAADPGRNDAIDRDTIAMLFEGLGEWCRIEQRPVRRPTIVG